MNLSEEKVFDMYRQCRIGQTERCAECKRERPNLLSPVSIYGVGEQYEQSRYKVLFVGKTAITSPDDGKEELFCDATAFAKDLYDNNYSVFWSYLREIAVKLYDEESSWEQIAFTNLVKCNDGSTKDRSTRTMRCNCIDFFQKELEILTPKHIVFFMDAGYDENIKMVFDGIKSSHYKEVKEKIQLWSFAGTFKGQEIQVLRCGHPQGKPKEEFVRQVVGFIKGT